MTTPACNTCSTPASPGATLDAGVLPGCPVAPDFPPARVGKALVLWLRYRFGAASRITRPSLKAYVWVDDLAGSSPITIGTLAEYRPSSDGTRPALLVERDEQAPDPRPMPIGRHYLGGTQAGVENTVTPMRGRHAVFCLGGREGEVDELAGEVTADAVAFCGAVGERLGLRRFRFASLGRRQQLREHKETWTVPVFFEYDYDLTAVVAPQAAAALNSTYLTIAAAAASP